MKGDHLNNLTNFDVKALKIQYCNQIFIFPNDSLHNALPTLSFISIIASHINEVPENSFEKFENLAYVDLSQNSIEKIHPKTFDNNSELKYLDLSYNSIKFFAIEIFNAKNSLEIVDLNYNDAYTHHEIKELEEKISKNCQKNFTSKKYLGLNKSCDGIKSCQKTRALLLNLKIKLLPKIPNSRALIKGPHWQRGRFNSCMRKVNTVN